MTQDHLEEDKKAACKWAYELLQRNDWCVLDTETTSLDGVAVEISAIAPDGTVLFDSLINPDGAPIHPRARAAHKLTDEELASAPKLPEIWEQLYQSLAPYKTIITYNAVFDKNILRRHAQYYGLPVLTQTWECAMERYAAYYGEWNDWHGSYRWQPLNGGHRALGDAQAALKRIQEMASYHVPEVKTQPKEEEIKLQFPTASGELLAILSESSEPLIDIDLFLTAFGVRAVEDFTSFLPISYDPKEIAVKLHDQSGVMNFYDEEDEEDEEEEEVRP